MQPTATSARSTQGVRKIVGVNAYADEKPLTIPILEMDPHGYRRQVTRLEAGAPEPRCRAGGAGTGPPAHRLPGHGEHHAFHPGGSARLCHPGRDRRCDEGSIWNLRGTHLDLSSSDITLSKFKYLLELTLNNITKIGGNIMANIKKTKGVIGILTGGGDVPGLNPAIRASPSAPCAKATR